ncbi:unnamed protein product [Rangifer tarandus platyrhynchus]|uniref:Uncharacterized protein n=2 Tax=Rangifer tarandus platyrhynchus TaxID=3082113 RepID=A0ACB0EHZ5_RANTA|nr:unnamed protein product [Rangifer tarandus platyrhynchus]CAI9700099.1 unnamed protein product [Rangifer tarandus platyrhynchus]
MRGPPAVASSSRYSSLPRPAGRRPGPRPAPLPGYVIEPTGPAGGETRARPRVPGLSHLPLSLHAGSKRKRRPAHRAAGEVGRSSRRPGSSSSSSNRRAGDAHLKPPHVFRPPLPCSAWPLPRLGRGGGAGPYWSAAALRPPPRPTYWPKPPRPRDRRRRRPSLAPALKRATRKRPPPCVPPLGLVRWLPAPPGPLPAPSGSGSGAAAAAAAAGRCSGRRGPIGRAASSLSPGLPEPRPAVARDPTRPARSGEGRWPPACGTRGRSGEGGLRA